MKRFFFAFFLIALAFISPRPCFAQAVLRAGETVDIRLAQVPPEEIAAFGSTQAIDEGGMLNIPYIGKIKVAGLDISQVQQVIETKLKEGKIYTNPTVTVTPQANTRLVNVTGEVKTAGRLTYTADLTVMTAIGGAGGFNDFADKKHVKLTREGKVQVVDTTKFSKDPSLDIKVLPGDQIYVPQASAFFWNN
ncbi:MAG: polysaccharide export protein [Verrucomicrobia bacterium]|nr:polysaccharide export protein [Verrucomicrobiota bacterium]